MYDMLEMNKCNGWANDLKPFFTERYKKYSPISHRAFKQSN